MTAPRPEPTAIFTTQGHTPVLIEDWLPIRELGIESVRERQAASALPPLSFLHVWWARTPLAAAAGVTLTALLPPWSDDLRDRIDGLADALERARSNRPDLHEHAEELTDADWYHTWILWLCGIHGDTVAAQAVYDQAKASGKRVPNPFTWKQAYKNRPNPADLAVLHRLLNHRWDRLPRMLDPTAGGGSIPFAAQRYGIPSIANELNPVAASILDATLVAPAEYGTDLTDDLKKWGDVLTERCRQRLEDFFPSEKGEEVATFLFANTIACPRTGGPVPLAPNWWLDKSHDGTACKPEPVWNDDGSPSHLEFEVLHDPDAAGFDPDEGTVARGDGVSPWDGLVIDNSHIKSEAQAGRMWSTLYAVAARKPRSNGKGSYRYFRPPTSTDLNAIDAAEEHLNDLAPHWERNNVLPNEEFPPPIPKHDIRPYGFKYWRDFFTPRQLLVHGVFVEEWRRLLPELRSAVDDDLRAEQIMTLLAMMQNKATNYNAKLSAWHPTRGSMANVFDRHDFALKWTFGEFEGARQLFPWCLSQLVDSYGGMARLMEPAEPSGTLSEVELDHRVPGKGEVSASSASDLRWLEDGVVEFVNIDPPYYDNVMYAELADFFYVWEKRTLGQLRPERFADELTNKDDEAVANIARFADAGKRRRELAAFDYRQKMQAIFEECHRVLADDGVMVVWFTHKETEAWDTLGMAMMEAGFTIEASWPVATQSETSLHHAKKNSAKSTVMLVCRKRWASSEGVFFDDIEGEVRQAAREAVAKFEADVGVGGVDLLLATYGPTLSVISGRWPVLSSEAGPDGRARRLKPEEALDVARQEVARLRMRRLVGRDARFDPETDFWLLAWETFRAREFPYDDARRLALGVGLDVDDAIDHGLLARKSGSVVLVEPAKRARSLRRQLDEQGRLPTLVDALHHLLAVYEQDGLGAARSWLAAAGYADESEFVSAVQAALNAVPRVRTGEGLALEEAAQLESAVVALFGDEITLPADQPESPTAEQPRLEM